MSLRTINLGLTQDLVRVSGVQKNVEKSIPIQGGTFFQREAFRIVTDCLVDQISNRRLSEFAKECFPLVDFLTKPRSIDEFQDLKRVLLNTLWEYGGTKDILTPYFWLTNFCMSFGIFPNSVEPYYAETREKPLRDIWAMYEKPNFLRDGKIVSFNEANKIHRIATKNEVRFGLMCGKFRLGKVHDGYTRTFDKVSEVLGTDGILLVLLDSEIILRARYGEDLARIGERLRLEQISSSRGVNYAAITPGFEGMETDDIGPYMDNIWKKIKASFYIVGSRDDPLFSIFEQRGNELGKIVLYAEETQRVSTSQVVRDLKDKF